MIINYAGLQLPVHKGPTGEEITPLKPLVDMLGLLWRDQRKKVTESNFYKQHLGIHEHIKTQIQIGLTPPAEGDIPTSFINSDGDNPTYLPEIFIRIDRIASYLMTINPERVRANGNTASADFLQQKIEEWADALHDYESLGATVNLSHQKQQALVNRQRKEFAQMIAIKNKTSSTSDRNALNQVIKQMAGELAIQYQQDLVD